jgi:hypothetical protein
MPRERRRCRGDLQQHEGQVRYDISVFINQLLLSFARTKKIKTLTLTMGLHISRTFRFLRYLKKDFQQL